MTSLTNTIVSQNQSGVNEWQHIIDLEPVIWQAARRMADSYDETVDELADMMRTTLIEKASPELFTHGKGYIYRLLINSIHDHYRKLYGARFQFSTWALDNLDEIEGQECAELACIELSETVLQVIESMDDECRALVQAIFENMDTMTKYAHVGINVNELARRVGVPKSIVYRAMSRIQNQFAAALAA